MALHELTVHVDTAAALLANTEERFHDFGSPASEQADQSDDLALLYIKADAVRVPVPAKILHAQHQLRRDLFVARDILEACVAALTDDVLDQVFHPEVIDGVVADDVAVAQHGDLIGDLEHFL